MWSKHWSITVAFFVSGQSVTADRYIRLTNLVPELLDLVDEGKIKMRPAVELSYLDEDSQRAVVDEIDLNQCTPSHDQTIRMRKFFTDGKLTPEVVSAIMGEEKPNQREKIVLRGDKVRSLIPKNIPVSSAVHCIRIRLFPPAVPRVFRLTMPRSKRRR